MTSVSSSRRLPWVLMTIVRNGSPSRRAPSSAKQSGSGASRGARSGRESPSMYWAADVLQGSANSPRTYPSFRSTLT